MQVAKCCAKVSSLCSSSHHPWGCSPVSRSFISLHFALFLSCSRDTGTWAHTGFGAASRLHCTASGCSPEPFYLHDVLHRLGKRRMFPSIQFSIYFCPNSSPVTPKMHICPPSGQRLRCNGGGRYLGTGFGVRLLNWNCCKTKSTLKQTSLFCWEMHSTAVHIPAAS